MSTTSLSAASVAPSDSARADLVRETIRTLRKQQRVVLSLYYLEELPLSEIAPVLDVTKAHVRRIHRTALKTLRERLAVA